MSKKRIWDKQTAKTRMISVRLPNAEFEQVKDYCDSNNISMTDLVRVALQSHFIVENWNTGKEDEGILIL